MLQARRTAAPQPQQRSSGALRVPLFSGLAARLRDGTRRVILDLGPARSGMIAFCSQSGCRLDIADIAPGLTLLNQQDDGLELLCQAEALLPPRGPEAVDVILCWDLLNYLGRRPLAALMERIAKRGKKGALVHALIVYSAPRMPVQPHAWFPAFEPGADGGEAELVTVPPRCEEREAPRYTPDDLRRCLPAYTIDRGVLLNNGMQEFLFRL